MRMDESPCADLWDVNDEWSLWRTSADLWDVDEDGWVLIMVISY